MENWTEKTCSISGKKDILKWAIQPMMKIKLNCEHCGKESVATNNMPVHLINSEQIGFSEQLRHDQKVPYYQV